MTTPTRGTDERAAPPGRRWRLLALDHDGREVELGNQGDFDELVVDEWFHIERMDENKWWLRVGDARIWVALVDGRPTVDVERGAYSEVCGTTTDYVPPKQE